MNGADCNNTSPRADNLYQSLFSPSPQGLIVLRRGKILSPGESPGDMIARVVDTLVRVEESFGTKPEEIALITQRFGKLLDMGRCVMSTPILTNAGRYDHKPLSACTVPDLDLANPDYEEIKQAIFRIHQDGMGTGFCLDDSKDPVKLLKMLNTIAIESANTGNEDRPVGNMAILSVYHPKIREFIQTKTDADKNGEVWKFNISVNCDEAFFERLSAKDDIYLEDMTKVSAEKIFDLIARESNACADPGIIFLDRMEADNPTPIVGHYNSVAPCAEVGLAKGESCQFAYINLARFLSTASNDIDMKELGEATELLTRMLDNALEISIENYSDHTSKSVMRGKRKIGIGICGLADLLIAQKIDYASNEARDLALDVTSFINYRSKVASHELSKTRGSFEAMSSPVGNKHLESPSFIEKKYGHISTKYVSRQQWIDLARKIRDTRLLRNASTIALPPTGRSSLIVDASTGIEPVFSLDHYLSLHPKLNADQRSHIQIAVNISAEDHLLMTAKIQQGVDESISKTINLNTDIDTEQIKEIYLAAWKMGLKGISVYREGSKKFQPKKLS